MTDKAWKRFERDVARHLGGERIYFVECKYRSRWAFWKHWEKAKEQARKHGKIPLLVVKEKNRKDTLVIMDIKDFVGETDGDR